MVWWSESFALFAPIVQNYKSFLKYWHDLFVFFTIFANENYNGFTNKKIGGTIMKQTREAFEAKNLEYENLYNEEDERRDYNSIWYN